MKKFIAIILAAMLMTAFLTGCDDDTNKTNSSNMDIEFWTDEVTGVQYVIYDRYAGYGGMGGITPRLNADGTLYVVD